MPRIRSLKPEHANNRKIGRLGDRAYRLWVNLVNQADDEGRRLWDAEEFRVLIWAYQPRVKTSQVEDAMQEIMVGGLSVLYTANGRSYYQLHDWEDHQRIEHPTPSIIPGPNHPDSCILMTIHEDSRGLMRSTGGSEGSEGSEGSGGIIHTAQQDAATTAVRKANESKTLLTFWFETFKAKFGQPPEVEGARDILAAKAILGSRTLEQAKAIVAFHFDSPAPFYAERKLFGLHHIRKDASQIIARMNGSNARTVTTTKTQGNLGVVQRFAQGVGHD